MAKYRAARAGEGCAVVAEDATGRWVARGAGRQPCRADSAAAAIVQALYGEHPARAVLLLPPKRRPAGVSFNADEIDRKTGA